MPKGIPKPKPGDRMIGLMFEGTREEFSSLMEIAALVRERNAHLDRIRKALDLLDAIEKLDAGTPAEPKVKRKYTRKTATEPATKKRKYTRKVKPTADADPS